MDTIDTISELLAISNCQYRVFDIGRKIDKITKADFERIEHNQIPYPTPSQGHAFLAIAFWQKQSSQPYLWFVKLPLDERGLLNQGARNHFIAIIVEALGSDLSVDPTQQQEELLKANPYHFTPAQYKLASLNSQLKIELKQNLSAHYEHCQHYLSGALGWDQWHSVAIQGISDFACRIGDHDNQSAFIAALPNLPLEVLQPLASALENQTLSVDAINAILAYYPKADSVNKQFLLRSLASSCQHPYVVGFIEQALVAQSFNAEQAICLAGRCWQVFDNSQLLMLFLEQVVAIDEQGLFAAIFKDLVAVPSIRPLLFQCMREPNRSQALAKEIGALFQANSQ